MTAARWLWLWKATYSALVRVPHATDCDSRELNHVGGDSWVRSACTCDRDARQAQLMVDAMRAAYPFEGAWSKTSKARTLAALKAVEVRPTTAETPQ